MKPVRPLLLLVSLILGFPLRNTATQVPASARIEKVENAGLLFTDNRAGVNGTDAGYSLPLGSRTLWLFGDVFLQDPTAPDKPFIGALSCCGLLARSGPGIKSLRDYEFLTDPAAGLPRQLIPRVSGEDDKVRLWPFGGWFDSAHKKVYLYYARVRVTGSGPLDFRSDGTGLAVADARIPERLTFSRIPAPDGGQIWWPAGPGKPVFGSAVLARGPWLYIYGYRQQSGGRASALARVRKDRIADTSAYEYLRDFSGGPVWTGGPSDAAAVAGLSDFPTELSVSYNPYLGAYLAVHSVNLGEKARLSISLEPWGPFHPIGEVGTRHQPLAKAFCYAGKEHPELAEAGGRIVYVTYVDSSRYWLHLLKVTLARKP